MHQKLMITLRTPKRRGFWCYVQRLVRYFWFIRQISKQCFKHAAFMRYNTDATRIFLTTINHFFFTCICFHNNPSISNSVIDGKLVFLNLRLRCTCVSLYPCKTASTTASVITDRPDDFMIRSALTASVNTVRKLPSACFSRRAVCSGASFWPRDCV